MAEIAALTFNRYVRSEKRYILQATHGHMIADLLACLQSD